MERRLAAILVADVVGYSRLIRADEEGTIAALKALRADLIDPKIAQHQGRVVKLMGDGMLAEFPSVVDAVRAAVETQRAVTEHNFALPEDKRIEFRVGINLGDVVIDGDDIHGDGVNIAARLEGLAEPGGICISGKVYEEVRDRTELAFEDLGEQEVKNIDRPVRTWRWSGAGSAGPTVTRSEPLPHPEKPSIAVLPFDNMSGDPDQEFFADGVAQDIITALSRHRWLLVIARNSAFAFKGQSISTKQIAQELGARYLLEGSVRHVGNRVRVTAQLIDAASDKHIWAERYDGDLADIFELQDDITRHVSASLKPELERAEWQRLKTIRKTDLTAWGLYLRGIWHSYKHTRDDNREALKLLQQAIESDEEFSQAFAAAAYVKFNDVTDGYTVRPKDTLQEALELAEKAVALDDYDAFAHFILGRVCSLRLDFEQAISELELAIKLNPSLADAYHGLGFTLTYSGHPEEAIPVFETAYKLSPHDANVWAFFGIRAVAYIEMHQYDEAIRCGREAVRKKYAKYWAFSHLLSALGHGGKPQEAEKTVAELLVRKPDFTVTFAKEHLYYYREPEQLDHYLEGLRKAGLPE